MHGTLLWLSMASLAFSSLNSLADGAPLQVLAAPNIFRVRTPENIFVECQDCSGQIEVAVKAVSHPTRSQILAQTVVTLGSQNNYQALAQLTIPDDVLRNNPNVTQYVYLQAQFPDRLLEKVVMVSFQPGYIFIQTDKTIYTPGSRVYFRMFAVTPGMEPIQADLIVEVETPDGIIFEIGTVGLRSGIMHAQHYRIPHSPSIGVWKVVAFFPRNTQQRFAAEFEVKEYVLPSFEVKLKPENTFFKVDSETFEVQIEAKYLYGEEVNGNAYVVFGVSHQDKKMSFSGSLQKVQLRNGKGKAILERKHINQAFPDTLQLVQSTIYATVSVLTQSGSELVEAEVGGIHLVTSPYTINFKKTPKYFKSGMPLDVMVHVTNPDHTPASGVPVMVNPGNLKGITDDDGIARVSVNTPGVSPPSSIQITANTPDGVSYSQASATITVLPYRTTSNHHDLHIAVFKEGQNMKALINFGRLGLQDHEITYLILSGGQIVMSGRIKRQRQITMTEPLTVTKEMLPSFRVIVYYHVGATEVVSDSVLVEAKYTCSLKLESATGDTVYEPGKRLRLKVTGDPGAMVGLVAVDKGVYVLNNKYRLTQRKVRDMVEKHDTGCTAGGGRDSMGVFYDAGLMFVSSTAFGTPVRTDPMCPVSARKKRATTIRDARFTLESQYKDELMSKCCVDGMKDIPLSYDCQRRSKYIVDGQECIDAFLYCCTNLTSQRADKKEEFLRLARSTEDDGYDLDITEIVSRTKFDESWLFTMVQLPNCSSNVQCEYIDPERSWGQRLPDSITTWQLTGISLSKSHGICVSEPFEVIARKRFFIDLRLPYSAVRGEQLEIKAILHNFIDEAITVRLELLETKHVCSMASRRKRYRQEVTVGSKSTHAVPFVIIPMQAGQHNIEVKGIVKDKYAGDGIMKKLLVFVKNAHNLNVTAKGNGEATLTEKESGCQKFNLSVELIPVEVGGDGDVYMLKIEVLYKDTDKDATFTILDIRLPTGFIADNKDLDTLSTGVASPISRYEIDKALSEQGSIIIYLEVSHKQPEEIAFRIRQVFRVGILQPAAVSVYEYYDRKRCVKFYRPEGTQGELRRLCQGNVCVCAEVYKVRVERFQADPSVDIYQMRIENILKEGTDDTSVLHQLRAFVSFPHCRDSLGLNKDKTFLIMGMKEDLYWNADKREYEYVLGERTWIEYWPTSEECQTEEYRHACWGMEDLDHELNVFECLDK